MLRYFSLERKGLPNGVFDIRGSDIVSSSGFQV